MRIPNGGDTYLVCRCRSLRPLPTNAHPAVSAEDGLLFVSDQAARPPSTSSAPGHSGTTRPVRGPAVWTNPSARRPDVTLVGQHPAWYPVRTGLPMLLPAKLTMRMPCCSVTSTATPKVLAEGNLCRPSGGCTRFLAWRDNSVATRGISTSRSNPCGNRSCRGWR